MPLKSAPISGWGSLRRRLNRFQNRFFREAPPRGESVWGRDAGLDVPGPNQDETVVVRTAPDGNILVKARLPGLKPEDIDLDVADNVLTLRGERRKSDKPQTLRQDRRKQYLGPFKRTFSLPAGVQGDLVDAAFQNGVLTITIPRSDAVRRKRIAITRK